MQWVALSVPVVTCEENSEGQWEPRRRNQTISVIATRTGNERDKVRGLYEQLADLAEAECEGRNRKGDAIAAIPEWWQNRAGADRPQLVVLFGEELQGGKIGASRWPLTIPHYRYGPEHRPAIPRYRKGNFQGIQTLRDNSKLIVNAASVGECRRVLNALRPLVDPAQFDANQQPKIGPRGGTAVGVRQVRPMSGRFFSKGQKNTVPDWTISFRNG